MQDKDFVHDAEERSDGHTVTVIFTVHGLYSVSQIEDELTGAMRGVHKEGRFNGFEVQYISDDHGIETWDLDES